jgi:hypothetical protein
MAMSMGANSAQRIQQGKKIVATENELKEERNLVADLLPK